MLGPLCGRLPGSQLINDGGGGRHKFLRRKPPLPPFAGPVAAPCLGQGPGVVPDPASSPGLAPGIGPGPVLSPVSSSNPDPGSSLVSPQEP